MSSDIRVRIAPSPTGYMHVGNARTALFDYLFARHHGGKFFLRLEDTDRNRFDADAAAEIYESLKWLGLELDEGPQEGGEYGPYVQSERLSLYHKHVDELIEKGYAYRCFCSSERLQQVRDQLQKEKKNLGYDRHCRELATREIDANLAAGMPHVVRLKVPLGETVAFVDQVRNETIAYRTDLLDDLVLLKSDGFPTYHMASIVDDHYMKTTHVFRGEEWIASTPSHVLLYRALGWEPPVFAHLPVILSPDGGKLSKRKRAASVMDFKRAGYLPDAMFNFLALVGWNPGDDREKMSREEIINTFTLERVSSKAGVFDEKKLEWMNGLYMAEATVESLAPGVLAAWQEQGFIGQETTAADPYVKQIIELLKVRSKRLGDLAENAAYFFVDPTEYEEKAAKKHFKGDVREVVGTLISKLEPVNDWTAHSLEEIYRVYAEESGLSGGKLIHPTRLAVSGVSFGPGLFEMLELLGKEVVLRRMKRASEYLDTIPTGI